MVNTIINSREFIKTKQKENMKNIIKKLMIVISSFAFLTYANAGDLSVTGTAKATYNIPSGMVSTGKAFGINNHIDFTGKGETDFGTFTYQVQMEPGDTGTFTAADQQLTLATSYGTFGIFLSEGGLDLEDGGSRGVYGRATDVGGPDNPIDNTDISSYNNVQYHTPAGLLPLGTVVKLGYVGNTANTNMNDSNASGQARTASLTTYGTITAVQVTSAPVDGLSVGASYMEAGDQGISGTRIDQDAQWGAVYAKYDVGAVGLGFSRSLNAPLYSYGTAQTIEYYKADNYSVALNVNENLSISYEREKNSRYGADTTADASQTTDAIQAAYTTGGVTLALSHGSTDNISYTNGKKGGNTVLAVTMAF